MVCDCARIYVSHGLSVATLLLNTDSPHTDVSMSQLVDLAPRPDMDGTIVVHVLMGHMCQSQLYVYSTVTFDPGR